MAVSSRELNSNRELVSPLLEEGSISGESGVSLSVKEVSYTVQIPKRFPWQRAEKKRILDKISARFEAGSSTSLMGPSGSGKTTLLEVIGGFNWNRGRVEGSVYARRGDGERLLSPRTSACLIPQDDVLMAGLTPRETLSYSARLRDVPAERAEQVLKKLGLVGCANTRVGSPQGKRGISGGQRKRVSIGLELLTNPPVLLCDEPTSGLDSKMALDVYSMLVALARDEKKTILCTVHQPSLKIHRLWDRHLLIANGKLAFDGPNIDDHFIESLPSNENPAEVYMEWLQDDAKSMALLEAWEQQGGSASFDEEDDDEDDQIPPNKRKYTLRNMRKASQPKKTSLYSKMRAFFKQAYVLGRRELHDKLVDPEKWTATLTLKIFVGTIIGVVWVGQAGTSQADIFPVQGALFIVSVNSMMDTTFVTALALSRSRNLLLRELRNAHYSLLPRHVAVLSVDISLAALATLALGIPVCFLVGLRTDPLHFSRFVATAVMLAAQGVCFGHVVGTTADDFQQVQQIVSPSLTPLILFSGYMIPKKDIPYALKWVYDISFFQYAVTNFNINEFRGKHFDDCPAQLEAIGACFASGGKFLQANDFNPQNYLRNFVILLACFVLLALLSFIAYTRVIARH